MAVQSYADDLIPFCESTGLTEVRRLRQVENHFHNLDWERVDKWISAKEAELKDESVQIARDALRNSRLATRIAIFALILSLGMAAQKLIEWHSKAPVPGPATSAAH